MRYYPSMNSRHATYGSVSIKEVYYPEEYVEDRIEDCALLVLDDEIGECTGYFGIYDSSKDRLEGMTANLYGYPGNMPRHDRYENCLWGMEVSFNIDNKSDIIDHNIDTSRGQSGSPIYIEENGNYYIFGVHVREANSIIASNQAVFLNNDRIRRIKGWIKDYYQSYRVCKLLDLSKMLNAFYHVIREGYLNINISKLIELR
jgi:V8-like Glu-specific endopeptidase